MKTKLILSIIAHHFLAMSLLVLFSDAGGVTIGFLYNPSLWYMAYGYPLICSSIMLWCLILFIIIALGVWVLTKKTKLCIIVFNIGLFCLFSLPIILFWITKTINYCGE